MHSRCALVEPDLLYQAEYLALVEEMAELGENRYDPKELRQDFPRFIQELRNGALSVDLKPGVVPQTTYWMVQDSWHVIGELRLRHYLTPALADEGGHIGYLIRPSERRKGYGSIQLALGLDKARLLGLSRVLITCDTANLASSKIIEHNGGVLASHGISQHSRVPISRYWIEL